MPSAIDFLAKAFDVFSNEKPWELKSTASTGELKPTVETILQGITHPDFTRYYLEHRGEGSLSKNNVIALFQNGKEFNAFAKEMLECLHNLCREHSVDTEQSRSIYDTFIARLELTQPNNGDSYYGSSLLHLYQFTCLHLKQMLAMLDHAKAQSKYFPLEASSDARAILKCMETELTMCGPGLMHQVENTLQELKNLLFAPDIHAQYQQIRIKTAQQCLAARLNEVFRGDPELDGFHIHAVNTWMQKLGCRLKLEADTIGDACIDHQRFVSSVAYETQADIETEVGHVLEPWRIVETMALNTLQKIPRSMDITEPPMALKRALTNITNQLGDLPESALFQEVRPGDSVIRVHTDPTLLIAELRQKLLKYRGNQGSLWRENKIDLPGESKQTMHLWGNYGWKEQHIKERVIREQLDVGDVANALYSRAKNNHFSQYKELPVLLKILGISQDKEAIIRTGLSSVKSAETLATLLKNLRHNATCNRLGELE